MLLEIEYIGYKWSGHTCMLICNYVYIYIYIYIYMTRMWTGKKRMGTLHEPSTVHKMFKSAWV